jgi:hypothetical protein
MSMILSDWVLVEDQTPVSNTYFAVAAQPNLAFTMANTTLAATHNGGVVNVTITMTGTNDNTKVCTVTGTDSDGAAQTEAITAAGGAATVQGALLFKTVTSATMSAQPAANISVGFGTTRGMKLGGPGTFGTYKVNSGDTAGTVFFRTGSTAGTILSKEISDGTPGSVTGEMKSPSGGVRLPNGFYVTYALDVTDQIIVFYTG